MRWPLLSPTQPPEHPQATTQGVQSDRGAREKPELAAIDWAPYPKARRYKDMEHARRPVFLSEDNTVWPLPAKEAQLRHAKVTEQRDPERDTGAAAREIAQGPVQWTRPSVLKSFYTVAGIHHRARNPSPLHAVPARTLRTIAFVTEPTSPVASRYRPSSVYVHVRMYVDGRGILN